jgi:hypothetical protein
MNLTLDKSELVQASGINITQPNNTEFKIILNSTSKSDAKSYMIPLLIYAYNYDNKTIISTTNFLQLEVISACDYASINPLANVTSVDLVQF